MVWSDNPAYVHACASLLGKYCHNGVHMWQKKMLQCPYIRQCLPNALLVEQMLALMCCCTVPMKKQNKRQYARSLQVHRMQLAAADPVLLL